MPICMWPRVKGIVEVPDMRKGNDLVDGRNNVISACQKFRDEVMKDNWRKKNDQKYVNIVRLQMA